MKRFRASIIQDLEAGGWQCWSLPDGRIVAQHNAVVGGGNMIDLPPTLPTILTDLQGVAANDADITITTHLCSPSRCADFIGMDDGEFAEHYGYGDDGLNHSLCLYAIVTGVSDRAASPRKK